MKSIRRLVALVAAFALVGALIAVPAGAAVKKHGRASALSKLERTQNAAIKRGASSLKKLNSRTTAAETALKKAGETLSAALVDVAANKEGLAGITAAVPTVLNALQQLADGSLKLKAGLEAAGAGLLQLKTGLETAGAGLVSLKNALGAAEFGVIELALDNESDSCEQGDVVAGQILVTPDIPDDTNQAIVSGDLVVQVPPNTPPSPLCVMAGIRSGEQDGFGADDPAGLGGIVSMFVSNIVNVQIAGGTPPLTTLPLASGPNADVGGAPVYPVPNKAPRVDSSPNPFTFPIEKMIELTDPATLNPGFGPATRFTLANSSATLPGVARIAITVRFVDLSASATDPTA
jgi:hypothetical protein